MSDKCAGFFGGEFTGQFSPGKKGLKNVPPKTSHHILHCKKRNLSPRPHSGSILAGSQTRGFAISDPWVSLCNRAPNKKDFLPKTHRVRLQGRMRGAKKLCVGERRRFQDCITPSSDGQAEMPGDSCCPKQMRCGQNSGPAKTMTARDVTGFYAFCSARKSGNFLHSLGPFSYLITQKAWRKKKTHCRKLKKNAVEKLPRNCRFLSLVVVKRVLKNLMIICVFQRGFYRTAPFLFPS